MSISNHDEVFPRSTPLESRNPGPWRPRTSTSTHAPVNRSRLWTVKIGSAFALITIMLSGASAQSQTLDELVREMLERNPAIQAARRAVDSKKAMVTAARTLPDPSVSFETMGNLIPPTLQSGDPSSARVFRFNQEIPFPGKLNLQGQIAAAEADAEWWKYEEVRRESGRRTENGLLRLVPGREDHRDRRKKQAPAVPTCRNQRVPIQGGPGSTAGCVEGAGGDIEVAGSADRPAPRL